MKTSEERFWAKVNKTDTCWLWTASKDRDGYGQFRFNGTTVKAHRVVIQLEGSDIPSGMCVLHHCDNPGCVNPDHLYIGTPKQNTGDMIERGRSKYVGQKGEAHGCAKLCELDVRLIRDLAETSTQQEIADWFGIAQSHVTNIVNHKSWAHVK
jgi:hypothetical protein